MEAWARTKVMRPLNDDDLAVLRKNRQQLMAMPEIDQATLDTLVEHWREIVWPSDKDESEYFALVRLDGTERGPTAPRWLFHLLGLPHRASHIGLLSPNGLVILQRRAATKKDWPNAWDMAVAGHVPVGENGVSLTFRAGAEKEMIEEIGLTSADLIGGLLEIGSPYTSFESRETDNPPFYNTEVRQIFGGIVSQAGMAKISPDYEELSGIHLCTTESAWKMLESDPVAGGMRYSLPRYLDWLAQNPHWTDDK
ncbi:MAG: NUDIX domain-containing protein [Chthonomonadales bacterium]